MPKFIVQWAIAGEFEVFADDKDAAEAVFWDRTRRQSFVRDLSEFGELEVLVVDPVSCGAGDERVVAGEAQGNALGRG